MPGEPGEGWPDDGLGTPPPAVGELPEPGDWDPDDDEGDPEDGDPDDGEPDDGEPDDGEPDDGEPDGDGMPPDGLGIGDWLLQAPSAAATPRAISARTVVVLMIRSPDESAAARRPVVRDLLMLDTQLVAAPGAEVHSGALPSRLRVRPAAGRSTTHGAAAGLAPARGLNC